MTTPKPAAVNVSAPPAVPPATVQIAQTGAAMRITLDRPAARNALDRASVKALAAAVPRIARDPNIYAVVLRSSRPGTFCSGGDVRELAGLVGSDPAAARAMLAAEYHLIWLLECFSKPTAALIDGTVMGAGAGLTLVNTHRIAAETYAFAMPEVHLGLFPDDGVVHTLARLPGGVGAYLALTGRRIGRADAFALRLVTHCIDADRFDAIEAALADAQPIDLLLDGHHRAPGEGEIAARQTAIDHCFGAATVEEIVDRLQAVGSTGGEDAAWAETVLADIAAASPLSLIVTLRHVRQARALDLRQTLGVDYRLASRLVSRPDFLEGVRAAVIDKDRRPRWAPASGSDVSRALVDDLFAAAVDVALELPTRQEMQAARV